MTRGEPALELQFLGAAGTVTGSKTLVSAGTDRVLVDCGLFQGVKVHRRRNWRPLPVDAARLDAVVLTHAHIDHSGWLPVLVRDGFTGPIYATQPTLDLCEILLPDSGRIQEEDAAFANRHGFSRHAPALPLYTEKEARAVMAQLRAVPLHEPLEVGSLTFTLRPAGHILGASSVLAQRRERSVLFTGDLGRPEDLLMRPPDPPPEADLIVMESTYGDRHHGDEDPVETLAAVVRRTADRGGVLLIPTFAVGRAQALLYALHLAFERGIAPRLPTWLDSPMATDVTRLYVAHHAWHRLTRDQTDAMGRTARFVNSVEQSKALDRQQGPMIVLSASGMLSGGRVLHHLAAFGPDPRNTVLLPGFQAEGTRGAALLAGAKQLKIHGEYVPIGAEVAQLHVFSAHADQGELLGWLGRAKRAPREVLLNHGEPGAADALRRAIGERFAFEARAIEQGERVELR